MREFFARLFGRRELQRDAEEMIGILIRRHISEAVSALNDVDEVVKERVRVEAELAELRRQHAELASTIERERTDVKFKLGLEKMRQEQDAKIAAERLQAQREQIESEKAVAIREARLAAKEEATGEAREMMRSFQDRQERMIGQLLDALPSAKIIDKRSS